MEPDQIEELVPLDVGQFQFGIASHQALLLLAGRQELGMADKAVGAVAAAWYRLRPAMTS